MDFRLVINKFKLKSRYYDLFLINNLGEVLTSFISTAMGYIVSLMFFHSDSFRSKQTGNVKLPLNEETEAKYFLRLSFWMCDFSSN